MFANSFTRCNAWFSLTLPILLFCKAPDLYTSAHTEFSEQFFFFLYVPVIDSHFPLASAESVPENFYFPLKRY